MSDFFHYCNLLLLWRGYFEYPPFFNQGTLPCELLPITVTAFKMLFLVLRYVNMQWQNSYLFIWLMGFVKYIYIVCWGVRKAGEEMIFWGPNLNGDFDIMSKIIPIGIQLFSISKHSYITSITWCPHEIIEKKNSKYLHSQKCWNFLNLEYVCSYWLSW